MARQPRFFVPGGVLHVILRGNNRQAVFGSRSDFGFFARCLGEASDEHALAVHAYVLMTNHIHLVATPGQASSAPKALQSVGRRYVQYFNRVYGRTGTLWEGRYRATIIDTDEYLLTCMRYVELNPVRAGLASGPQDYRWSSYLANAFGRPDDLVRRHDVYVGLAESDDSRAAAYRALFHMAMPDADIALIRERTNRNWALGSEAFRQQIERLCGRRASPSRRGRCRGNGAPNFESDPEDVIRP